jgi:hypothetical protein
MEQGIKRINGTRNQRNPMEQGIKGINGTRNQGNQRNKESKESLEQKQLVGSADHRSGVPLIPLIP